MLNIEQCFTGSHDIDYIHEHTTISTYKIKVIESCFTTNTLLADIQYQVIRISGSFGRSAFGKKTYLKKHKNGIEGCVCR